MTRLAADLTLDERKRIVAGWYDLMLWFYELGPVPLRRWAYPVIASKLLGTDVDTVNQVLREDAK